MQPSENKIPPQGKGRRGEIVRYLIFGVLTTAVSLITNFAVLWGGSAAFGITEDDAARYITLFTAAKVISWVCAVIFAFFTNKKWVFNDPVRDGAGVARQLIFFSGGRLATLGLDWSLNIAFLWLISALPFTFYDGIFGLPLSKINELSAWGLTQFFVVAANYFLSKWFVFIKKQ